MENGIAVLFGAKYIEPLPVHLSRSSTSGKRELAVEHRPTEFLMGLTGGEKEVN